MCCETDGDYGRAWCGLWPSTRTIINVEHDHDPTDTQIQALLDCPHPLCTYAYVLWHLPGPAHYAQRLGGTNYGEWVAEGAEWCDYTGVGFCKITPEARVRPLAQSDWQLVDCAIFDATEGPWHIHWPAIRHDHH